LEPIAGLLLDIGRIVPPRQLLPELGELPLVVPTELLLALPPVLLDEVVLDGIEP